MSIFTSNTLDRYLLSVEETPVKERTKHTLYKVKLGMWPK